ncbi:MAG TPA: NAD-dependent epimerase/dehydratase family protein [Acidimicrobiales bacterium]|nr:NAD-dependent epimerase/dehydratase family protein [Acidimicrobiales bacterium]
MSETFWNLPTFDVDGGVQNCAGSLESLRGARVLITGGTGFLGSWLVSSLLRANTMLGLGLHLVLLTRNPDAVPIMEGSDVSLLRGDVRTIDDPGEIDFIVHGAATSSSVYGQDDGIPKRMAATVVEGTQAVLDLGAKYRSRILFLSSGAVYGPQTAPVSEDCTTAPDSLDPRSTYGQAKRLAETLCAAAIESRDVSVVVARLFAFVGPRIPLDRHFAVGNFIRDALDGRPIIVAGDGVARRSYMYTGDLPEWCWTLIANGRSGVAYNVGSPTPVTIAELAHAVARIPEPRVDVQILGTPNDQSPPWYVPVTTRAETEFGLGLTTPFDEALRKTYAWFSEFRARA